MKSYAMSVAKEKKLKELLKLYMSRHEFQDAARESGLFELDSYLYSIDQILDDIYKGIDFEGVK